VRRRFDAASRGFDNPSVLALQPLKLPGNNIELISAVETSIAQNKFEKDADLFKPLLRAVRPDIDAALFEFRQKISMGEYQVVYLRL
jgi:hypothetical protein